MNAINTTLTTSGNSVAVRLPKELLRMSGLGPNIQLEASDGKIIISNATNPRDGWAEQIAVLMSKYEDPSKGFEDMKAAANDGLDDLPWDGPSFEEWISTNV